MTEIQTTTAGSLPRTRSLIEANGARTFADDGFTLESTPEFEELTAQAVADVVARQRTAGITQVGDGSSGGSDTPRPAPSTRRTAMGRRARCR